jgi:hypothetical protein
MARSKASKQDARQRGFDPQPESTAPMLFSCVTPGCSTLTMGGTCVEHDVPLSIVFPRGRPHVPAA